MSSPAFHPTSWTLVTRSQGEGHEAKAALSDLCAACYQPVVAFLQREGRPEDEARELAHGFFAQILAKGVGRPSREHGRFRNYLLGALKHYLANQRLRRQREKRGGGMEMASLEELSGMAAEDAAHEFDRAWAFGALTRALAGLEAEHAGKAAFYAALKPWLDGRAAETQAAAAARLGMTESAVKVAIHRLRGRFRELLLSEIAATVADPAEVMDEARHLLRIVSQGGGG
jgi:DNA-directed RNA polymerase specialized sigma24 family protein